jgi:large subunit ribosomal protein LP2
MAMKYLAAYLMAVVAEDSHPTKAKVEAILKSIGATVDNATIDAFFQKVAGKNAHELIAAGLGKLSSFAAAAPAAAAGSASPSKKAAASPKAAAKKEEVRYFISDLSNILSSRMRTLGIWVSAFSIKQFMTLDKRLVTISTNNRIAGFDVQYSCPGFSKFARELRFSLWSDQASCDRLILGYLSHSSIGYQAARMPLNHSLTILHIEEVDDVLGSSKDSSVLSTVAVSLC